MTTSLLGKELAEEVIGQMLPLEIYLVEVGGDIIGTYTSPNNAAKGIYDGGWGSSESEVLLLILDGRNKIWLQHRKTNISALFRICKHLVNQTIIYFEY